MKNYLNIYIEDFLNKLIINNNNKLLNQQYKFKKNETY